MYAYVAWKEGKFAGACLFEPKSERVREWLHNIRKQEGVTLSSYGDECSYLIAVGLACPAVPRPQVQNLLSGFASDMPEHTGGPGLNSMLEQVLTLEEKPAKKKRVRKPKETSEQRRNRLSPIAGTP